MTRDALRAAGLRVTLQRMAVLDVLVAAAAPLAHHEIAARLALGNRDRATIYRNLVDLVTAKLARRVDLGDRTWRFEAVRGAPHAHFICTRCGSIRCLDVEFPALGDVEVQLRGICDSCRAR